MIREDITSSGTRNPCSINIFAISPTSVLAVICDRNKSRYLIGLVLVIYRKEKYIKTIRQCYRRQISASA